MVSGAVYNIADKYMTSDMNGKMLLSLL